MNTIIEDIYMTFASQTIEVWRRDKGTIFFVYNKDGLYFTVYPTLTDFLGWITGDTLAVSEAPLATKLPEHKEFDISEIQYYLLAQIDIDELTRDGYPRKLPVFEGYTVDERLEEFRKAEIGKTLEFIPFDSEEGKELLQAIREA